MSGAELSDEERQALASEDGLARRVARERRRRGWSQETLAAKVEAVLGGGFPQSAVSKIEKPRGRRSITVDEALALSEVLEIPLLELVLPPEVAASKALARLLVEFSRSKAEVERALAAHAVLFEQITAEVNEHPDLTTAFMQQLTDGDYSDDFAVFLEAQGRPASRRAFVADEQFWSDYWRGWGFDRPPTNPRGTR